MKVVQSVFAVSAAFVAIIGVAFAQDAPMEGHDMAAMDLPAACQAADAPAMQDMGSMDGMSDAQKAAMQGMMRTQGPMMQGMMAEDPDVAFACGMIPHHQAAISMAEVELQYGDSDDMKEMARKIIEAQKQEIAELTQFVESQ